MRITRLIGVGFLLAAAGIVLADEHNRARRRTPIVDVIETCRDAVVNISTTRVVKIRPLGFSSRFDDIFNFGPLRPRNREVHSVGSGVVIHEVGFIVTNAHVVAQASDVQVIFSDDQRLAAETIAIDQGHDLAVLRVEPPEPLPAISLGRSNDLMIGETVVAIGNPLGLQHSVTAGIISALNRDLQFSNETVYSGLIQTDAPINPGNSGGPLLNINSELIGINTAIRGDAQNIGFAIPVDHLWELVPQMLNIERRQRVRFGLEVRGPELKVMRVRPDSPAARVDLKPGDRITSFNGDALDNAIDYHVHLLAQQPDSKIRLGVKRGDEELTVAVPLERIPPPDGHALALRLLGLDLKEIPRDLRRKYDLPQYVGLVVEGVEDGGPGDYAGVRAGDIILGFHGVSAAALDDVGLLLEQTERNERVIVEGLRVYADPPFRWTVELRARGTPSGPPGRREAP